MPSTDIALNKAAIIERCIRRIHEEYAASKDLTDQSHVDALTLNIERACQAAIDLAMHTVAAERLGAPQSSADAFAVLARAGRIPRDLEGRLRGMTGFRNIAIHQYQQLDTSVLTYVAITGWRDLVTFCGALDLVVKPETGDCRPQTPDLRP